MPKGVYERTEWHLAIIKKNASMNKDPRANLPDDCSGSNNGRWKGGRSAGYILNQCNRIKKKTCKICDTKQNLIYHHKDHDRMNNRRSNIEVLCRTCHCRIHDRIKNIHGGD